LELLDPLPALPPEAPPELPEDDDPLDVPLDVPLDDEEDEEDESDELDVLDFPSVGPEEVPAESDFIAFFRDSEG
jgi:hypothetical protein